MSNKEWLIVTLGLLVVALGLMGFSYIPLFTRPQVQYFAILPDNTAAALTALERPNVSTKALLSWVTLAATATFSFDFVNYHDQLEALKDYFTIDGFNNFLASLQTNNTLSTIEDKKLIVTAVPIGPAIVLLEEELGDKHNYRIQVPLLIRYQSASVNETQQQVIETLVTQVSTSDAPKGIGIQQYVAREAGPEINI
jgi:intracellular multiplication protein IcmL